MNETRLCKNCNANFEITPDDQSFYNKIGVPAPTLCPLCRLQRRLAYRNERSLYKRRCDLCKKDILSMYPSDTSFPVYCRECWISDAWDALEYGRDYDFKKNFFEQFLDLQNTVPRIALEVADSVQSDYINQAFRSKNCYLIFAAIDNEDCFYGQRILNCRSAIDNSLLLKCETSYESTECRDSARIFFTENASDVMDLWFCFDARGSQHCFMSSNLRNASYRFRNKQLTKDEYDSELQKINFGSFSVLSELRHEYDAMKKKTIRRFSHCKNVVNSVGQAFSNANNCYWIFNGADLENSKYGFFVNNMKDSYDINNTALNTQFSYECNTIGVNSSNLKFCNNTWPEASNMEYCDMCKSGSDSLFGCIGLRSKKYCVFNKVYSKDEYQSLTKKIRLQMAEIPFIDHRGIEYRYGEFFPIENSVFPYMDSSAQELFPLTPDTIRKYGYNEANGEKKQYDITVSTSDIPDDIRGVDDSILKEVLECAHGTQQVCEEKCTTAFRITSFELRFYRQYGIALPRLCPNCRHFQRFRDENLYRLYHRQCVCEQLHPHHTPAGGQANRCPNEFETSYAPDRPEIVYCEACYQSEVI